MFLHNGKEYYPLEVSEILGKNGSKVYDRKDRNKPYIYIMFENTEEKVMNNG